MEQQNVNGEYDEISLRELIEALIKGKKLIAMITIACFLLGAIASFVILPEKYEATSVLLVSPVTMEDAKLDGIDDIIDYMNNFPTMTVETYMQQIKTPQVLQKTIEALEMKNKDNEYIRVSSLSGMVDVSNIKDTNLINIKVTGKDPEQAANIANTVSKLFIEYVSENNKHKNMQVAQLIEAQLVEEEKNVATKSQAVVEYLANSISIDELSQEVSSLVSQITSTKSSLNSIETQIDTDEQALKVLLNEAGIKGVSNVGNVNLEIDTAGNVNPSFKFNSTSNSNLQSTLLTIDITKIQSRLVQNIASKEAKVNKLEEMQSKLLTKQTLLEEEKYKFNALNRDLALANQAYNAYQQRHKEAMIASAADIGNSSIIVSSEAMVPHGAASPNKILNMAIALVLGLMIGVFVVFAKQYWESTTTATK